MATFFSILPVAGGKEKLDYLGSSRVSLGQQAQARDGQGDGGVAPISVKGGVPAMDMFINLSAKFGGDA